jgi:hypothetical protein
MGIRVTRPNVLLTPPYRGPILYMRGQAESDGSKVVGLNFHFSLPPTVTTGFIGFYFDIRK